jgi:hypothetical protein
MCQTLWSIGCSIYEKDPEYFKKELKKQKGKPKRDSVKTTLSNLNTIAGGCGGCIPQFELKTVQIKYAEKPKPPVKVSNDGYIVRDENPLIKVDFS